MTLNYSRLAGYCYLLILLLGAAQLQAQSSALVINNGSVAGTYECATPVFSAGFAGESAELAFPNGNFGTVTGCATFGDDLSGKIALVNAGACPHAQHATNAMEAGAIAVIICNHIPNIHDGVDVPSTLVDDASGAVNIPVLALDSTSCTDIIIAMGSETLSATLIGPAAGETCISAIPTQEGTNTVVMSTAGYGGTIYPDATHATWYTYTAPYDGTLTISSCGAGVDTRLIGFTNGDCENILNDLLTFSNYVSLDVCDDGQGNIVASEVSFAVSEGEVFKFYWDDSSSSEGFDFTINTLGVPVMGKVSVDMSNEVVDANGAFVNGSFTGGMSVPMTFEGDGIFSYSFETNVPANLSYSFYNGTVQEDVAGLISCGNGVLRTFDQTMAVDFEVPVTCFSSCDECPIVQMCADPSIIICEDFEPYDLGGITGQSDDWVTWSGGVGTAEDAEVSMEQSSSGAQSLKVSEAGADDLVLILGERTTGNYSLDFQLRVPGEYGAYWNIQKIITGFSGQAADYSLECFLAADGSAFINAGGATAATFNFPQDEWFSVELLFNLDSDWNTMKINGVEIYSWPASQTASGGVGDLKIGAVNFFGFTNSLYYVDDIFFRELPPLPLTAVTFQVDLELEATQNTAYLEGSFNSTGPEVMSLVADQKYSLTKMLALDETYTYKFQNGLGNAEMDIPAVCVGADGNRELTVSVPDITLPEVCFSYCEDCQTVDVNEAYLGNGITVFPNPANDLVVIDYNFEESITLEVKLYNNLGQSIFSKQMVGAIGQLPIDVSVWTKGVYFVEFSNGQTSTTKRLIVQ